MSRESMSGDPPRAHYDDIEFDDQLAFLDGAPFTGVVYADHIDGGLELEYNYAEGLPSGIQPQWPAGERHRRES